MCGEHAGLFGVDKPASGSSPHVRGTLTVQLCTYSSIGIIPACAGNTSSLPKTWCASRDHPRMCGEHREQAERLMTDRGSSPHVRGTLGGSWSVGPLPGIIPACAGNTYRGCWRRPLPQDHPRMCGEHFADPESSPRWLGSSPHVRGTLVYRKEVEQAHGIIPACAGNTSADL